MLRYASTHFHQPHTQYSLAPHSGLWFPLPVRTSYSRRPRKDTQRNVTDDAHVWLDPSSVVQCPFNDVYTLHHGLCNDGHQAVVSFATPCAGHTRYHLQFARCISAHMPEDRALRRGNHRYSPVYNNNKRSK